MHGLMEQDSQKVSMNSKNTSPNKEQEQFGENYDQIS